MKEVSVAAFSGGRSSAYMVKHLIDTGNIPNYILFANTGLESPDTYEFISAVDKQLFDNTLIVVELDIVDGEYLVRGKTIDTCNKTGVPFEKLIVKRNGVPNVMARYCTDEMKLKTMFRFLYQMYDYKTTKFINYVGIRGDEPRRIAGGMERNEAFELRVQEDKPLLKWSNYVSFPLNELGITKPQVLAWFKNRLEGLSFDPSDPNVWLSNCLGCQFGNQAEHERVIRDYPSYAQWWQRMSEKIYDPNKILIMDMRRKWIKKYLGRELDETSIADTCMSNSYKYSWANLEEYVKLKKKKGTAIPIEAEVASPGGCGDMYCNVD